MSTTWEMLYSLPAPKKVRYERSVVSYVDILGFGELIKSREAGEISKILRILAESVKPYPGIDSKKICFTKFSDTVIRTIPVSVSYPHNFVSELRHLIYAQMALIPLGVPIRGAVTVGEVVQSWDVVYGPAVIEAYTLERRSGSPPVISVGEDALKKIMPDLLKEGLSHELKPLIRSEGSGVYLDYLTACEAELNVPDQEYPIFLKLHRDFIRNGLTMYARDENILKKYQWLRDYHERVIANIESERELVLSNLHV